MTYGPPFGAKTRKTKLTLHFIYKSFQNTSGLWKKKLRFANTKTNRAKQKDDAPHGTFKTALVCSLAGVD